MVKTKYGYLKHHIMKQNRLVRLQQTRGHCDICGKRANKIHHKDLSKNNHSIENLIVVCNHCHGILHRGRKNVSRYTKEYGRTATEIAKQFNCSLTTIHHLDKIKTLAKVLNAGGRIKTSKFLRVYDLPRNVIAEKLKTTLNYVQTLHTKGLLAKALEVGIPVGYEYHSKYRTLYGASAIQLAKRLKCSYAQIVALHFQNRLKEAVEQGYWKRKSKIRRIYGMTAKELSKILHCRVCCIYFWHNDLSLSQRLRDKNFIFPVEFSLQTADNRV